MTRAQLTSQAEKDVGSLPLFERKRLLSYWTRQLLDEGVEKLFNNIEASEEYRETADSIHSEIRRRVLLSADVIGITTSRLAKDIGVIRKLGSKLVVLEAAAEVLEAHTLSALMPGVEHFIQIGDHQQLRPQITDNSLNLESTGGNMYQLDRSQFERLARGQSCLAAMPVAQLDIQRRLRPEISKLIRTTVYPSLQDHNDVTCIPNVAGMRDNVFWLDHKKQEDLGTDDGPVRSHSNEWEVAMTKALVRHLIRQGTYKSTDVAVLTPYSGQLVKLRAALYGDFSRRATSTRMRLLEMALIPKWTARFLLAACYRESN